MEFYDGARALIGVARKSYTGVLLENLRQHADAGEIYSAYVDSLFLRWWDTESGEYTAPEPPSPPDDGRLYHGHN